MIYTDDLGEKVVFKSFNTNYMTWLFSKPQANQLYSEFLRKKGNMIISIINEIIDDTKEKQEESEIKKIKEYILNLPDIYFIENSDTSKYINNKNNKVLIEHEEVQGEFFNNQHSQHNNHLNGNSNDNMSVQLDFNQVNNNYKNINTLQILEEPSYNQNNIINLNNINNINIINNKDILFNNKIDVDVDYNESNQHLFNYFE